MEQYLLQRNQAIMDAVGSFAEVATRLQEGLTGPPQEWVEQFGQHGAAIRFTIAKMALEPNSRAPFALHSARSIVTGFIKSRAGKMNIGNLNVMFASIPEPRPVGEPADDDTEVIDVTGD
jgi:hypothetical protein